MVAAAAAFSPEGVPIEIAVKLQTVSERVE